MPQSAPRMRPAPRALIPLVDEPSDFEPFLVLALLELGKTARTLGGGAFPRLAPTLGPYRACRLEQRTGRPSLRSRRLEHGVIWSWRAGDIET